MAPILTIFGPNRSQRRNLFFEKFSNERRRHRGIVVVVIVAVVVAIVAVVGRFWVACIKGKSLLSADSKQTMQPQRINANANEQRRHRGIVVVVIVAVVVAVVAVVVGRFLVACIKGTLLSGVLMFFCCDASLLSMH